MVNFLQRFHVCGKVRKLTFAYSVHMYSGHVTTCLMFVTTCARNCNHFETTCNPSNVISGELIFLADNRVLFLGNPMVTSLKELAERSLKISDIPRSDSTRELILLKHQRSTEFDLMWAGPKTWMIMDVVFTWLSRIMIWISCMLHRYRYQLPRHNIRLIVAWACDHGNVKRFPIS